MNFYSVCLSYRSVTLSGSAVVWLSWSCMLQALVVRSLSSSISCLRAQPPGVANGDRERTPPSTVIPLLGNEIPEREGGPLKIHKYFLYLHNESFEEILSLLERSNPHSQKQCPLHTHAHKWTCMLLTTWTQTETQPSPNTPSVLNSKLSHPHTDKHLSSWENHNTVQSWIINPITQ